MMVLHNISWTGVAVDNDSNGVFGFCLIIGIIVGGGLMALMFIFNSTSDNRIRKGSEFMLDGSVYKCAVTKKLEEGK